MSIFDMDATTEGLHKLSIGLERILKLALISHQFRLHQNLSAIEFSGRSASHDILQLTLDLSSIDNVPEELIDKSRGSHGVLLETLTQFAKGSRYYHIDSLLDPGSQVDPLPEWLHACYYSYKRNSDEADLERAAIVAKRIGPICALDVGLPWVEGNAAEVHLSYLEAALKDGWRYSEDAIIILAKIALQRIRVSAESMYKSEADIYRDGFEFLREMIEEMCLPDQLYGLAL